MMSTFPFLKTPTQEYVVPRSMPIIGLFFASRAETMDAMLKRATRFTTDVSERLDSEHHESA